MATSGWCIDTRPLDTRPGAKDDRPYPDEGVPGDQFKAPSVAVALGRPGAIADQRQISIGDLGKAWKTFLRLSLSFL